MSSKLQMRIYVVIAILVALSAHLQGPYTLIAGSDELLLEHPWVYGMIKSSLMLYLLFIVLINSKDSNSIAVLYLILAIIFSFFGDVFLLFEGFFLHGLASFLIAHLFFITLFVKSAKQLQEVVLIRKYPLLAMAIAAMGGFIFYKLAPYLHDFALPVLFYVMAIVGMGVFALNRYGRTTPQSFRWVFIGALFFMFSDTIIAFDRFVQAIPFADAMIMSSYAMVQGLIVFGILKHFEWENNEERPA
ncbi:MAG: lysoplasmalogenase [Flavobacteriales bacterium]|nr:lysoplasmalogenase [Flavobacteriales bacterium]